jgi:hypothetical protein
LFNGIRSFTAEDFAKYHPEALGKIITKSTRHVGTYIKTYGFSRHLIKKVILKSLRNDL